LGTQEKFIMLLRIILSENDIRIVATDNLPETADDFYMMLKTKLGLDGDLVVQYQDPEFDNELFNLSSMSELPKDKATLKVLIKLHHTDSNLDTISLSSSSLDESPHGSKTRQLPQPFVIPAFSFDAYHRDGALLDISKDMKSDILDKLAEAIYVHSPYPKPDEYDHVAQALINRHPRLKEPGSVNGWYCWKFSLKFKMGNFQQKLRVAGCSELKVNLRSRTSMNFLPDFPEGKTQSNLDQDRSAMVIEMKKRKADWKQIGKMMNNTFPLRRKEIVEEEPLVAQVKERWPALFSEQQVYAEFNRVVTKDLQVDFFEALDCHTPRFEAKKGSVGQTLTELVQQVDANPDAMAMRTIVLRGLPVLLGDDSSDFYNTDETWAQVSVGVLTVVHEDEQLISNQLHLHPMSTAMLREVL
uniref:PB1 domain-containing protein n=1 Tax=Myripristis murdjan TaxID=586833 RepID=A0A667YYQ7_9TELE